MVFIATATIINFINEMIATSAKPTILEFATEVHKRFYPEQDIAFMNYFFELASQENEGKFVVPHQKLIEYGIATSGRSSAIKERLESLGLEEGLEYLLQDILQQLPSGAKHKKVYMLTPEAFKKCLMRARRYNGQTIDVTKYANYYLFLEKVVKYYDMYQSTLKDILLSQKDDKIDELTEKIDQLTLLGERQLATLDIMNDKLDVMFDFMLSFARMTIPMWLGSSVIKTQFDNLAKSKDTNYALTHLKVMFTVSFFNPRERPGRMTRDDKTIKVRSHLKTYFCCTNFADVAPRIKLLDARHGKTMYMLKPQAICLISCEINTERVILDRMGIFPEGTFASYAPKTKSFNVACPAKGMTRAASYYDMIVANARKERFQGYQARIDGLVENNNCPVSDTILGHITKADEVFFASSLPFCQQFVDCHISEDCDDGGKFIKWKYACSSRATKQRPDLNNARFSDRTYTLRKLQLLIDANNGSQEIDTMVKNGIISKKDISSLKKLAKLENIDMTEIEFPEDLSDGDSDANSSEQHTESDNATDTEYHSE